MAELTVSPGNEPVAADGAKARECLTTAAGTPNIKCAYRANWRDFPSWSEEHSRSRLPAHPASVALYLRR